VLFRSGAHPLDEVESVFAARDPLYRALATREIEGIDAVDDAVARMDHWPTW
jgi:hypothetical protein